MTQLHPTEENVERFFCGEFDRDEKMILHQEECTNSTPLEIMSNSDVDHLSNSSPSKKKGKLDKHKKVSKAPESDPAKPITTRKEEKMNAHVSKCNGFIPNNENDLIHKI